MTNVRVLLTGGTLDKSYNKQSETLDFSLGSIIPHILERANSSGVLVSTFGMADSAPFTDGDFREMARTIASFDERSIVVVHGTTKMVAAAKFFESVGELRPKCIVLTGAFQPARIDIVEASFNVGAAICASKSLASGVHIVMHGECFEPAHTHKNVDLHRFVHTL